MTTQTQTTETAGTTRNVTHQQFCSTHPILQATHSGLWGWERIFDSLNLTRCVFATAKIASKNRKLAYEDLASQGVDRWGLPLLPQVRLTIDSTTKAAA